MYLSELSKGTAAAGAALELRRATATLTCSACGKSEPYDNNGDMHLRCVKCGGANRLDGGNELYVDSIEVNT
jgi:Zn finger protein HypA/HybF involved in hydrogenase expression